MTGRHRLAAGFGFAGLLLALRCASPAPAPAPAPTPPTAPTATPAPTPIPRIVYPEAPLSEHYDDIHGRDILDSYRTLENGADPQTVAWLEKERELTTRLLDRPERSILQRRIARLYDYPKISTPIRRAGRYFFSRREGDQNQAIWYVQDGADGERRTLLDPNTLSEDGTVAIELLSPSRDARYAAYAITRSGSDRQEIRVREVATGEDTADELRWVKFSGIAWTPDNRGFYYTRYPEPGSVPAGDEHYFPKICYHRLGDPQSKDRVVYERPNDKEMFLSADVSRDGRWLMLGVWRIDNKAEVWLLDRRAREARPRPAAQGFDALWQAIDVADGHLYLRTDKDAPRGRVARVDLRRLGARGAPAADAVVGEAPDVLESVAVAGRRLVLQYLHNAHSVLTIAGLDGQPQRTVELPELGSIRDLAAAPDEDEALFSWTSYTRPSTPYRLATAEGTLAAFEEPPAAPEAAEIVTEQVFYPSKDGTRISMFLVHRRGLVRDRNLPVYLYGYGGFAQSMTPAYSVGGLLLASSGGVLAIPNLRGGGEYGEDWHLAGKLEKRKNVYDDFMAAAEWLVTEGWTNPQRLAIGGGSNGGLLTAWCVVRHPRMFKAAISQVPVTDLLRYHKFTVGRYWIGEYGDPDDPDDFVFLFQYSPYHQIRGGRDYPATLITTADSDDRVDPAHARKFAASLQNAQSGPAPILLRVESRAGHGHGKPLAKTIEEATDIWTFLFWQLGITPAA